MLDESKLILNSTDKILLYEIYKQLVLLNSRLEALEERQNISNTNTPLNKNKGVTAQFDSMKRADLMKLVSRLKDKPKGWTKFSNEDLINFLEKEG